LEPKIIVITGSTCSGKTFLSLKIARIINAEIISADSRQIYKYLSIGTAKPSVAELKEIPHHFIDILLPNQPYNPIKFEKDALATISEILQRGNTPIVVGGSGLYVKSLVYGIADAGDNDEEYREKLYKERELYGNEFIYEKLKDVDPVSASKMLPQNWKRVIRALEVFHLTGKSINEFHLMHKRSSEYNFIQFGIEWDREVLYEMINKRVDYMITNGLIGEVKNIIEMGYDKKMNALNTPGYKEIISYLEGDISVEQAVELIKRNTRRYAKRQLTWFKADKKINWNSIKSELDFESVSQKIINELKN